MTLGQRNVVLNGGEIQQIDSHMSVYERPATLFVAGFNAEARPVVFALLGPNAARKTSLLRKMTTALPPTPTALPPARRTSPTGATPRSAPGRPAPASADRDAPGDARSQQ
jgi:hypothetical protein